MNWHDVDPSFKERYLTANRVKVASDVVSNLTAETMSDAAGKLALRVHGMILSRDHTTTSTTEEERPELEEHRSTIDVPVSIRVPATWWDHLKLAFLESRFRAWFLETFDLVSGCDAYKLVENMSINTKVVHLDDRNVVRYWRVPRVVKVHRRRIKTMNTQTFICPHNAHLYLPDTQECLHFLAGDRDPTDELMVARLRMLLSECLPTASSTQDHKDDFIARVARLSRDLERLRRKVKR